MKSYHKKSIASEENSPHQTPLLDAGGGFSTAEILCVAVTVPYFAVESNRGVISRKSLLILLVVKSTSQKLGKKDR
jgi:hypothetical protein